MRKTIASLSCAALLLANAAGVLAQTTTVVTNSGSNANISNNSTSTTVVSTQQSNNAVVTQSSTNMVNTGGNTLSGNIAPGTGCGTCVSGSVDLTTGAGTASTVQEVDVNKNTAATEVTGGNATSVMDVVNTGNNLNVNAGATSTTVVGTSQTNNAMVSQGSMNMVNTGGNDLLNNIGNVSATTGAGAAGTVQKVTANENTALTIVQPAPTTVLPPMCGLNPCLGGLVGGNGTYTVVTNTGKNLNVSNNTNNTTVVTTGQSNKLFSMQYAGNFVNTGDNLLKKNIGGTSLTTGAGLGTTLMELTANKNVAGTAVGSSEMPLGGSLLDVVNTGANANVSAGATDTTVVGGSQTNFSLLWQKTCNVVTTGVNGVLKNIGVTSTVTGVAGGGVGQSTTANSNMYLVTTGPLGLLGLLAFLL
ncbi:hypothetical protein A3J15_01790 [Candidatus Roizmanbacteria bacterium RIFCSPLOWO2_02_FULL_38_10]|uniref:Uncharacterized protein n=1 Tax=Candidatus Roizmanbacteria bacterium RIFCSPLOWO2_02_FULL_38_10 TaxID=1802074 RepID=A0A1F7JN38_9BACT|nr:MAG: hypothetical protein A3J15_01790 [Candidatus Roizmanbacteria bacterium RIFCSPLOWO2_02_FULL_38_10]